MRVFGHDIQPDSRTVRLVVGGVLTFVALGAFITRDNDLISWIFLAPTVAAAWVWAQSNGRVAAPLYVLGLVVPPTVNIIESDAEVSMFIAVVVTTVIVASTPRRLWLPGLLGGYLFLVSLLGIVGAISDFAWPNWAFGLVFAWGVGELLWRLTRTVDELEEARALVIDQAAIQERRRIARDVHDLVGHSLTVVMLHVAGARHVLHDDPEEAERALGQAEDAARESLAEIRRTVGLLRDESDSTPDILPTTGLYELPNLIDEFVLAGLDVDLDLRGPLETVDQSVGVAAYRIVQESLTNVSRHAPGAQANVTIVVTDELCEVVVRSHGGTPAARPASPGFGLVSMRERARSVGGSLLAGPITNGWSVEASLPGRVEIRS